MLTFSCLSTFHAVLPACFIGGIVINIGLEAGTIYNYTLTTPYGKQYSASIQTDAGGEAVLDTGIFPEGLFNPHLKLFQLVFYKEPESDGGFCDPVSFTICGVSYNNIALKFVESNLFQATIGCECEEV